MGSKCDFHCQFGPGKARAYARIGTPEALIEGARKSENGIVGEVIFSIYADYVAGARVEKNSGGREGGARGHEDKIETIIYPQLIPIQILLSLIVHYQGCSPQIYFFDLPVRQPSQRLILYVLDLHLLCSQYMPCKMYSVRVVVIESVGKFGGSAVYFVESECFFGLAGRGFYDLVVLFVGEGGEGNRGLAIFDG